jgi:hypothetical protein
MTTPDEPNDTTGREACATCGHPRGRHDEMRGRCPKVDASPSHEWPWRETTFVPQAAMSDDDEHEERCDATYGMGDPCNCRVPRWKAEGEAAERARNVARLRVTAREVAEGDAGMSATEWLDSEADAIEAGEHGEKR